MEKLTPAFLYEDNEYGIEYYIEEDMLIDEPAKFNHNLNKIIEALDQLTAQIGAGGTKPEPEQAVPYTYADMEVYTHAQLEQFTYAHLEGDDLLDRV